MLATNLKSEFRLVAISPVIVELNKALISGMIFTLE